MKTFLATTIALLVIIAACAVYLASNVFRANAAADRVNAAVARAEAIKQQEASLVLLERAIEYKKQDAADLPAKIEAMKLEPVPPISVDAAEWGKLGKTEQDRITAANVAGNPEGKKKRDDEVAGLQKNLAAIPAEVAAMRKRLATEQGELARMKNE